MKIAVTDLPGVLLVEPRVFEDPRGWFMEAWREENYVEHGIGPRFVQSNVSHSARGVVRGLHYQWPQPQGKLVWAVVGRVLDVAVDIRPDSPTFSQWTAVELSAENHRQLWVPEGFAHGFQVLDEHAVLSYLCTRPYRAEADATVAWNDSDIGIEWPLPVTGLSTKDAAAPPLRDIDPQHLPTF